MTYSDAEVVVCSVVTIETHLKWYFEESSGEPTGVVSEESEVSPLHAKG